MPSDSQKTTTPPTPVFMTGLFWGLVVGFILALFIYKNNPKLFKQLSEKLHQLLKNTSFPPSSPKPSSTSSPPSSGHRPSSPRRPKTFIRSKK